MDKPIISIIVPIYNVEKYLSKCLESVICQDFDRYEIIAVNDGSTDSSLEICKYFSQNNERIKIINQKNRGLSDARNAGIRESVGDYLLFLDSDDFLEKGSLKDITKYIEEFSTDVIIGLLYNYYDENRIFSEKFSMVNKDIISYDKNLFINKIFHEITWPAPKYIIKRKLILDNNLRFKSGYLHEDVDWTTRLFLVANSFSFYEKPFYYHRMNREGSITNIYNPKRAKDVIQIIASLIELIDTKYANSGFEESIRARLSKSSYYYVSTIYFFDNEDRELLLSLVEKNMNILKYTNKNSQRFFYKLFQFFGLRPVLKLYSNIRKINL